MAQLLEYTNEAGRAVIRSVEQTIDIRRFTGLAVYPWLVMTANQHLSNEEVALWLEHVAVEHPAVQRPYGWIKKRRKMTRLSHLKRSPRTNRDGLDGRALEIIAAHQRLSAGGLVCELKQHGIVRSREWVRTWRAHSVPHDASMQVSKTNRTGGYTE